MNRQQKQVRDFNRAIQTPNRLTPGMPSAENRLLRARLILEEALEVIDALGVEISLDDHQINGDVISSINDLKFEAHNDFSLTEAVDGMCDLKYVTDGTADALGVDLEPFFEEVHHTNMQKLNGPKDSNGKQLKPPGWKPPRIAEMLKSIENVPQDQQIDVLTSYLLRCKNDC